MKKESPNLPQSDVLAYMRSVANAKVQKAEIITVEEWTEFWLMNYCLNLKTSTISSYDSAVKLHINRVLGKVELKKLSAEDVQLFINSLHIGIGTMPMSPKTIKNIHGVLHKSLDIAVTHKYISDNHATHTILPKIIRPDIHAFTNNELLFFLKSIKGHSKELPFIVAVFTGMRQGEIVGLTWDCINFEDGSIYIYRQLTKDKYTKKYQFTSLKNGKSRTLYPASIIMNKLFEYKNNNPFPNSIFVFNSPATGTHYTHTALYNSFKKLVRKIGYPNMRFHDLRHTYALLSIQAGEDIKTLQINMGHHSAAFTLDVYGHCNDDMKRKSSTKMSDFIKKNYPGI